MSTPMNSSGRKRPAPALSRLRQPSSLPKRSSRAKTPDASLPESDDEIVDIVSSTKEDESGLETIEANSCTNAPVKKGSSLIKAICPKKQGAVWEHIVRSTDNDKIVLSCIYCKKKRGHIQK